MLKKIEKLPYLRNYYKIAIIIICLNSIFELVFQYRFQADIKTEAVYFVILGIVSIAAIRNMVIKKQKKFLSVFYCFWPIIMLFIYFVSSCKFSLLPLLVSSLIILFLGKYKQKLVKISATIFITAVAVLIVACIYFFPLVLLGMNKPEVIEMVSSFDNKYIMVLEETDLGATGGYVEVYCGRNIDFGYLGRYMPKKIKYHGYWGERPDFNFVNDHLISVNGELIEMKGQNYLSNNEPYFEARQLDDKSAEKGEIIRYKKENGDILQYKITIYGETGRVVENYYFTVNNTIYYTRLEELYSSPISLEKEVTILSRTFKEGVIINGQFYDREELKADFKNTDDGENMYDSLEELNAVFDGVSF